jgi:hypothetical protein
MEKDDWEKRIGMGFPQNAGRKASFAFYESL